SKYRERSGRKCPKCQRTLAFEPREGDPFTDVAFKRAIEAVSATGQVSWGVEHLYYELCRRQRRFPGTQAMGILAIVFAVGSFVLAWRTKTPQWLGGLLPALMLGIMWALGKSSRHVRLEYATFSRLYDRWVSVHGVPARVITRKPQPSQPKAVESDLADYS